MLPIEHYRRWRHRLNSLWLLSTPVLFTLFGGAPALGRLVINATFDSTITSDPNAAVIERTINSVIALYEASFSDPVTVSINFQEMSGGLGQSSSFFIPGVPYSTFRSMLAATATTANDTNALAHLPAGSDNPVNGSTTLSLTLPHGRALGFSGPDWDPPPGQPDGIIFLNTSLMNLDRTSINPAKFDLFAAAAHEIDEVLGLTSALDGLANGDPAPKGDVQVMDLFWYDQNGNRSFTTATAAQAWFSLDGTTRLVRFNQDAGGDFHDWSNPGGQPPRVQDAFATPGATPNPTVELVALDVIGYHFMVPAMAITNAGKGRQTISWSPKTPGFILQERTNLASATWLNSASGTNNPVTITDTTAIKFFRVFHP